MAYIDVVLSNYCKFDMDIDEYCISELYGVFSRFISYKYEVLPDEPEEHFKDFKEYDKKTNEKAKKYVAELYKQHVTVYVDTGPINKKLFSTCFKYLTENSTTFKNDKVKTKLFKDTLNHITSYEPPKSDRGANAHMTLETTFIRKIIDNTNKDIEKQLSKEQYAETFVKDEIKKLSEEMNAPDEDAEEADAELTDAFDQLDIESDNTFESNNPNGTNIPFEGDSDKKQKATINDVWNKYFVGPDCVEKKQLKELKTKCALYEKQLLTVFKNNMKAINEQTEQLSSIIGGKKEELGISDVNNLEEDNINEIMDTIANSKTEKLISKLNLSEENKEIFNEKLNDYITEFNKTLKLYRAYKTSIMKLQMLKEHIQTSKALKVGNAKLSKSTQKKIRNNDDFASFLEGRSDL